MMTKVSVVIPMYNAQNFITECLNSCIEQTYSDIEIIVVDDGSTDNSVAIASVLPNKGRAIKIFRNVTNQGTAFSRNIGVAESTGEYVAFLDADDFLTKDSIAIRAAFLDAIPEIGIVAGHSYVLRDGNPHETDEDLANLRLRHGKLVSSGTGMIRKRLIKKFGGFNSECVVNEDREFWARMLVTNQIKAVKILQPVSFYRVHENSKVRKASIEERQHSTDTANRILGEYADKLPPHSIAISLINWGI